ncbi:hypothetical protein [Undibacterium danionis]|uniref:Uncharacterized protein n=1 Tax=Undibacterium danionis TaxID=1812100 RepID=A0ABV6IHR8_9BURK
MKKQKSTTWSDDKLRFNVEKLRGSEIASEIGECISSINQRNLFLHYHFSQIIDLLKDQDEIHQVNQMALQIRIGARTSEEIEEFYSSPNVCSDIAANIYAFIQSKHAVIDMLSYVICLALDYNPENNEFRNFEFAKRSLKSSAHSSTLSDALNKICGDHNFNYLKELTNTAKHQRLVKITFDGELNAPQFEAFNSFPQKNVLAFLEKIHDSNGQQVIDVLKELDRLIEKIF